MMDALYDIVVKATGVPRNYFDNITIVESERQSKVKDDYANRLKSIL
jgi:hypothetical protein